MFLPSLVLYPALIAAWRKFSPITPARRNCRIAPRVPDSARAADEAHLSGSSTDSAFLAPVATIFCRGSSSPGGIAFLIRWLSRGSVPLVVAILAELALASVYLGVLADRGSRVDFVHMERGNPWESEWSYEPAQPREERMSERSLSRVSPGVMLLCPWQAW